MNVISFHKMGDFTYREKPNHASLRMSAVLKRLFDFCTRTEGKAKRCLKDRRTKSCTQPCLNFFSIFKAAISLICCPPQPGDESYETFIQVCSEGLDTVIFELTPRKNYFQSKITHQIGYRSISQSFNYSSFLRVFMCFLPFLGKKYSQSKEEL